MKKHLHSVLTSKLKYAMQLNLRLHTIKLNTSKL